MITAGTPGGRAFKRFGRGSVMTFPPGALFGEHAIEVGQDTLIGQQVSLTAGMMPGQDLLGLTVLSIGDRCVIGRGSHVVAHESVTIGDDVWTGPYIYITDQNHGYQDPDTPIGRQLPVNRPVSIGAGSWLGAGAIILPGTVIGRNVVVAAGSVVRGEVPDHCVVAGVPARVIRARAPGGWQSPLARQRDAERGPLVHQEPAGPGGGDQAGRAQHRQVLADAADGHAGPGGQAGGGSGFGQGRQQRRPGPPDQPGEVVG
jgi:carbonic anhydrase/acetyltransferase-like protein (isoleucine patch superfamily)